METSNDEVLERILDFKEKVENPNQQKSGEEIGVEDAVWLIEALLNYQYCNVTEEQSEMIITSSVLDSLSIDVSVNTQNQINYYDVVATYLAIEKTINEIYEKTNVENKFFNLVDVEFKDGNFKTTTVLYLSELLEKSVSTFYQPWLYGFELGKCLGGGEGNDASSVLEKKINRGMGYPAFNGYFTDINYTLRWSSEFPTNDNPLGDYLLFEYVTYNPNPPGCWDICVSVDELNYYEIGVKQALDIMKANLPSGRTYKSWDLTYHYAKYSQDGSTRAGHHIFVYHGVWHNGSPIY